MPEGERDAPTLTDSYQVHGQLYSRLCWRD
jgi:hypothetical protein